MNERSLPFYIIPQAPFISKDRISEGLSEDYQLASGSVTVPIATLVRHEEWHRERK